MLRLKEEIKYEEKYKTFVFKMAQAEEKKITRVRKKREEKKREERNE